MKLFRGRKKSETGTRFKSSQQLFDTASKATAGFTDGVPDKQSNPDAPILVNRSPDSWEQWGCLRCAAARRTLRAAHCTRTAVLLSGRSTTISSCLRQDWNTTTSSVVFRGGCNQRTDPPFLLCRACLSQVHLHQFTRGEGVRSMWHEAAGIECARGGHAQIPVAASELQQYARSSKRGLSELCVGTDWSHLLLSCF